MRPEIAAAVESIRNDREHGARQLAIKALRALEEIAPQASPSDLREGARALAAARPNMAIIANAIAATLAAIGEAGGCLHPIQEMLRRLETATARIVEVGRTVIPDGAVVTHSYSSTLIAVLAALRPKRVIVAESRPLFEGRRTARELAQRRLAVTLITDPQVGLFIGQAAAVAVGADSIFPDGSVVNKAGTYLLALAARHARLPFFVVGETLKVAPPSLGQGFAPEEHDPREVLAAAPSGIEVRNLYFDVTPPSLVSAYISEEGLLSRRQIRSLALRAEGDWRKLMG